MNFENFVEVLKTLGLSGRTFVVVFVLSMTGLCILPANILSAPVVLVGDLRLLLTWAAFAAGVIVFIDLSKLAWLPFSQWLLRRKRNKSFEDAQLPTELRNLKIALKTNSISSTGSRMFREPRVDKPLWSQTYTLYKKLNDRKIRTPNLSDVPTGFPIKEHVEFIEAIEPLIRDKQIKRAREVAAKITQKH